MNPTRILAIVGTRPEAIKMAPVIQELKARPEAQTYVCSTGQHREMLNQVLQLFDIVPDYDLDVMQSNQTPTQVAALVLLALDPVLEQLRPDWVLVQGDTTTVMAAAIAAHYRRVRVGHVEAGLRTYDRENPFPEEMNRVVTDHISDLHFAPTSQSRDNLLREGINPKHIFVTGNTVIDALLAVTQKPIPAEVQQEWHHLGIDFGSMSGEVHRSDNGHPSSRRMILVTAHRRENHGLPLQRICAALRHMVETYPNVQIVYPVHRNPNVWDTVHDLLGGVDGITLLPPTDYLTLACLMKNCTLVLTDSGGIQEEAPSLGKPVLVLRETTERPEAVEAGVARLVGTDTARIVGETARLLQDPDAYSAMAQAVNPYGDGFARQRIADALLHGSCNEFA